MGNTGTRDRLRRRSTRTFLVGAVAYLAIVIVGAVVLDETSPTWAGVVVAMAATVPALIILLVGAVADGSREGVEREVLLRSTSVAFFVTMASLVTYGLLESFAGFTATSAWWFFGVAVVTWSVAGHVLRRRLA